MKEFIVEMASEIGELIQHGKSCKLEDNYDDYHSYLNKARFLRNTVGKIMKKLDPKFNILEFRELCNN